MDDPGFPGWIIGVIVLFALGGLAVTAIKVSMARDMARRAGLDPDQAAATTLFTQNGLDATYLAASLRAGQQPASAVNDADAGHVRADLGGRPTTSPRGTTAERLRELQHLREESLITDAEYDERRRAILAEI